MTGKVLDSGTSGALVLILPMALVIVVLLTAWPVILLLIALSIGVRIWQNHQWKQWCKQVDPFFHQLIKANQGCLTPIDLSIKANLTGRGAKQFLDKKAEEYGAQRKEEDKGTVYYFLTASALGSIFDDSEPSELDEALKPDQLASASSTVDVPQSSASNIAQLVVEKKQTSDNSSQTNQDEASDKRSEAQIDSQAKLAHSKPQSSAPVEHKASIPVEEIESQAKLTQQESQSSASVEQNIPVEETESQAKSTQQESQSSAPVKQNIPVEETKSQAKSTQQESQSSAPVEHKASIPVEEIGDSDTAVEDSLDSSEAESPESGLSLIQAELAKRLDLHSSTIGKRKSDSDFPEWSQSRDPEGIAWQYVPETKMFVPSEEVEQN